MTDYIGTANYPNLLAAQVAFDADKTAATTLEVGRQLCICMVEAGKDPGPLTRLPAA